MEEPVLTRSTVSAPSGAVLAGVAALVAIATLGAVFGGPPLSEHETIVAECARNMRLTGDWLVPWFMETPFMRKPPLPYWLVAAASYVLPADSRGLPVTTMVARLPSVLAGLGTVLLVWRLGILMFGRRTGAIAAVIAASSVVFLLYSPNATVEMILTFCCTWAYLHFWIAVTTPIPSHRRWHMLGFYVALGLGMLAKGPAPMAMVAVPLAVWWYTEHPLRLIADRGRAGLREAPVAFLRGLKSQTIEAFKQLWLIPGLVVFLLCFVPWMLAVAAKYPHSWDLWNWQYAQRAQGNYLDTRDRSVFYYLPIVIGLTIPWLFLLPEALAAPWLPRYERVRRALFYCGVWAVVGIVIMSLESFKKPYYMVPAMPALILMMAVVADRFYAKPPPSIRLAWLIWFAAAIALGVGLAIGYGQLRRQVPDAAATTIIVIAGAAAVVLLIAGILYMYGRGWAALGMTALTSIAVFHLVWYVCGPTITSADRVGDLSRALEKAGVPAETKVLWADTRPDGRLNFYFGRRSGYMITPAEIVTTMVDRRVGRRKLMQMAMDRAAELLAAPEPVYLILKREHYDLARTFLAMNANLLGSVHTPGDKEEDDWVIVSNVQPATRAAG